MKYGITWFDKTLNTSLATNIGNEIQSYAMLQLLYEMNIKKDDITFVKISERAFLKPVNDEKIILLINEPLGSIGNDREFSLPYPLPEHITPVFLGLSLLGKTSFPTELVDYLRRYEPIGCRDEFTMKLLRQYGIDSYLFGCMTLTYPCREEIDTQNKIFVVDIAEDCWDIVPEEIRNDPNIVKIAHMFPNDQYQDPHSRFELVKTLLNNYSNNAKLVITSRLHAASPCIALGIPVIYLTENHSKRLAWIDKILPVNIIAKHENINWAPKPIDVSKIKELMRKAAKDAIISAADNKPINAKQFQEISQFWEDRPKYNYENMVLDILDRDLPNLPDKFRYIIWGCGLVGERIYQIVSEKYKDAELALAVDTYVRGDFHGLNISPPDEIINVDNCIVFVATYTGRDAVTEWMDHNNKKLGKDYIFFSTTSG